VSIEVVAAAVVTPRGAGVSMPGGISDVLQRDAGFESLGDEAVAQAVRCDLLGGRDVGGAG